MTPLDRTIAVMSRRVKRLSRGIKRAGRCSDEMAPVRKPRSEMEMNTDYDVLIIGAGLSGIGMACQIQREFPEKRLAILERRNSVGGTWDLFRYPGIRSDS